MVPHRSSLPFSLTLGVGLAALLHACATTSSTPAGSGPGLSSGGAVAPSAGDDDEDVNQLKFLKRDHSITFTAEGLRTSTIDVEFEVLSPAGVRENGIFRFPWSPWRDESPQVTGVVFQKDGDRFELDPSTFNDRPASSGDNQLMDNSRVLEVPLPGLEVGARVQLSRVMVEKSTLLTGRSGGDLGFWTGEELGPQLKTMRYPTSLPLRYEVHGEGISEETSRKDGWVTVQFTTRENLPDDEIPPNLPPDVIARPTVIYSIGQSWGELAGAYHEEWKKTLVGDFPEVAALTQGKTPEQKAQALLEEVHRRVRYTGLEFGEAAIIPWTPAEVLARGYGDCKDQATLLVGMLRAAGLKAHVALLRAGAGEDVRPGLPSLTGFNHAIVYAEELPFPWIDPTRKWARVGELPDADRGRQALVIRPGTRDLTPTPALDSRSNTYREVRSVHFDAMGRARLIEVSSATGEEAWRLKDGFVGFPDEQVQKTLRTYLKDVYDSDQLTSWSLSDPAASPVELRVEGTGLRVSWLGEANGSLFVSFAQSLPPRMVGQLGWPPDDDAKAPPERTRDYVFYSPEQREVRYEIHLPPGYSADSLPPPMDVKLGAGRLLRTAQQSPGRVEIAMTYDPGPARYTAAELKALEEALPDVRSQLSFVINLRNDAVRALDEGRYADGIGLLRARVDSNPADGEARALYALGLARVGMGEQARQEAEQAARLAPNSASVQRLRAETASYDLLGVYYGPGMDRPTAEAALGRAMELDPEDPTAPQMLIAVLLRSPRGVPWGPGSDVRRALELTEGLLDSDGAKDRFTEDTLKTLRSDAVGQATYLQDCKALDRAIAREEDPGAQGFVEILQARCKDGPSAATETIDRLVPSRESRLSIYSSLAGMALNLRDYPLATEMVRAQAALDPGPARAAQDTRMKTLSQTRRAEDLTLDLKDPEDFSRAVLRALMEPGRPPEAALPWLHPNLPPSGVKSVSQGATPAQRSAAAPKEEESTSPLLSWDLMVSTTTLSVQGDDRTGFRVTAQFKGSTSTLVLYLLQDKGQLKLAAMDSHALVAAHAVRLIEGGDQDAARTWTTWALKELARGASAEHPAAVLAGSRGVGSPADLELIARAMTITECSPATLAALSAARGAPNRIEAAAIDQLTADCLLDREDFAGVLALLDDPALAITDPQVIYRYRTTALTLLHREAEAAALVHKHLLAFPNNERDRVVIIDLEAKAHGHAAAVAAGRAGIAEMPESDDVANNLAWTALFPEGMPLSEAREMLEPFARDTDADEDLMHTSACLAAADGDLDEAHHLLLRVVVARGGASEPVDAYVVGLVAEGVGLTQSAARSYEEVIKAETHPPPSSTSTAALAQARLDALKAAPQGSPRQP